MIDIRDGDRERHRVGREIHGNSSFLKPSLVIEIEGDAVLPRYEQVCIPISIKIDRRAAVGGAVFREPRARFDIHQAAIAMAQQGVTLSFTATDKDLECPISLDVDHGGSGKRMGAFGPCMGKVHRYRGKRRRWRESR